MRESVTDHSEILRLIFFLLKIQYTQSVQPTERHVRNILLKKQEKLQNGEHK